MNNVTVHYAHIHGHSNATVSLFYACTITGMCAKSESFSMVLHLDILLLLQSNRTLAAMPEAFRPINKRRHGLLLVILWFTGDDIISRNSIASYPGHTPTGNEASNRK